MKARLKRGLASFLATVLAIGCLGSGMSLKSYAMEVVTEEWQEKSEQDEVDKGFIVMEEKSLSQYAIYPIPQSIVYGEEELTLTSSVVIVADKEVDDSCKHTKISACYAASS